jgi:DNA-binding MarR family transcriptional regulator
MNAPRHADMDTETVDLGEMTGLLGLMLRLAQVRIYEQFYAEFAGTDVRPGEYTVLAVIALNPGMRQGVLARTLHIKPAHMTKLVARLVANDMVTRTVPPEDRRSIHLALTPKGRGYLERHGPRFQKVHAAERLPLTDQETEQLLGLLRKLAFKEYPECP